MAYFEGSTELTAKSKLPVGLGSVGDFQFWHFADNEQEVSFSLFLGEVIEAGTDIYVYPKTVVKPDRDAFHIVRDGTHFPTKVTFEHHSSSVVVSTDGLSDGRYSLVVGELRNQELACQPILLRGRGCRWHALCTGATRTWLRQHPRFPRARDPADQSHQQNYR